MATTLLPFARGGQRRPWKWIKQGCARLEKLVTNGMHRLRANLDEHIFFWITLVIALYIFLGVPQVTNVWRQSPPWRSGFSTMAGFLLFLSFLIGFYALSMFVVVRRFPIRWIHERVEHFVHWRMKRWRELGGRRFIRPTYWVAVLTWRAPDLCCRWLVWSVSGPAKAPSAADAAASPGEFPKVAFALLAVFLIGSAGLYFGPGSEASQDYPLAGAWCQNSALLCLAGTVWLAFAIPGRLRGSERPHKVWLYFGRFVAWLMVTTLVGEVIWILAFTNWWNNVISYRLYTIWAVFELLTILVITGLLVDRWHAATDRWPVRQVGILLLPVLVWLFCRSLPVDSGELARHLSPDQRAAWKALQPQANCASWHAKTNKRWLAHLRDRVIEIPDADPVVLVAASGGGSRAAIFAALVLETLARTPAENDANTGAAEPIDETDEGNGRRTWADNIALISSVSGGSLAAAYHVERRAPGKRSDVAEVPRWRSEEALLNSVPPELTQRGLEHARNLIQIYLKLPPQGFPVELFADEQAAIRANPAAAVEALNNKADRLRQGLHEALAARKIQQGVLVGQHASPSAESERLEREITELGETITSLRTGLALLAAHDFLLESRGIQQHELKQAFDTDGLAGRWIWHSRAFDEMCIDFMAPLARGILSPGLDRGDALARFWTHRFGWTDCTNFSGYHCAVGDWNFPKKVPAVVFNAVDVARGSRLAVGFPPLPTDLWDGVYRNSRRVTRETPHALNAPVSLARAVRMSSNFPYGFRPMEFQMALSAPPSPGRDAAADAGPRLGLTPVHVLDGGVVDNTGLDTIYEIVAALEYHADTRNGSPYQGDAWNILAGLRRHGVCILEIDAGAKPDTNLPSSFNPLGGVAEARQALANGAYSNADRAKQFYLDEIRRILSQQVSGAVAEAAPAESSLPSGPLPLPPTAFHYCFQCNHYQPGQGADPAIMTAWALGPRDKAEVLARFLPELALWDTRREQLLADVADGKKQLALLRTRAIVARVAGVRDLFKKVAEELSVLERNVCSSDHAAPDAINRVRQQYDDAKKKLVAIVDTIAREADQSGLLAPWEELDDLARLAGRRLAAVEQAQDATLRSQIAEELKSSASLARRSEQGFKSMDIRLQAVQTKLDRLIGNDRKDWAALDPQMKYDQAYSQTKEVYGGAAQQRKR
jgi:hypothetical protein